MTVWISVMEAAARLKRTHQTVRNMCAAGRLRRRKLAPFNFTVVDAASVERQLKKAARAGRRSARRVGRDRRGAGPGRDPPPDRPPGRQASRRGRSSTTRRSQS